MYKVNDLDLINPENFNAESDPKSRQYRDMENIGFYLIDNQIFILLVRLKTS